MGGQACILYGGAEFSRDVDLAVLAAPDNLQRLGQALDKLQACVIAVPPFKSDHLLRGHAIHFRCSHPEVFGLRIDVMSNMRGVSSFEELWGRRTTFDVAPGLSLNLLSLPDLVKAKKTQRDKDWPMIRRLIEADYTRTSGSGRGEDQVRFWLRESRTPAILKELGEQYPTILRSEQASRPLLALAIGDAARELERALLEEELQERQADRQHWEPLRRELEQLRHRSGS
jgi:hypothetical protein